VYGYIMRTEQPIEAYHRLHRVVVDLAGSDPRGLRVHFAYPTERGYDMVEVWESKDQVEAFNRDIVNKAFERLGISMDGPPPEIIEFEPVEVITPLVQTPASR
jgi:hypothetical protein